MLRPSFALAIAAALLLPASLCAQDGETWTDEPVAKMGDSETPWPVSSPITPRQEFSLMEENVPNALPPNLHGPTPESDKLNIYPEHGEAPGWFDLHNTETQRRHIGIGHPYTTTSWLNRPYYVGADIGTMWFEPPMRDINSDIDTFGGIFIGYDWDYYWSAELAVHRSTPELVNRNAPGTRRGDRYMLWTANLLFYPLGDAAFRPYIRYGLGASEIDFPTDDGYRHDESLWTIPIGLGWKHPVRPWLASRLEVTDNIAFGNSGIQRQNNISLIFGLEYRFGAHPKSYWPWNPGRYVW